MTYILVLVFSSCMFFMCPNDVQTTEYSSKESCEVALREANKQWRTIKSDSKCVSMQEENEKLKKIELLKRQIKELSE